MGGTHANSIGRLRSWTARCVRSALGVPDPQEQQQETLRLAGEIQELKQRLAVFEARLRRASVRGSTRHLAAYLSEESRGLAALDAPKSMIFVSARFRTGSSFLYSLLARSPEVAAFYEPLNPVAFLLIDGDVEAQQRTRWMLGHTLEEEYFEQYRGLDRAAWKRLHGEALHSTDILLGREDGGSELHRYIQFLIDSAGSRRPALQFNRLDFRLGWVRAVFPQALIVNLRRSPRAIFRSYRAVKLRAEETPTEGLGAYFQLDEMFEALGSLLSPPLFPGRWNDYEKIYLLSRLSDLWGDHFAHEVVAFEDLVERPAEIAEGLLRRIGVSPDEARLAATARRDVRAGDLGDPYGDEWYASAERRCEEWLEEALA